MNRTAFQRLEALFHRAVELPPEDRGAFVDRECGGDAEIRQALLNMLRMDLEDRGTDGQLASPVARQVSDLRHDAPTLPAPATPAAERRGALPEIQGYELLQELGRGGMGVVYKARQIGLNRLVALKMLLPFAAPLPEHLARFRTEAEALARLSHPNIIPIYDVGECPAGPYYSMEFVPGPSLAAYLDGKPCDARDAARLVEVLAAAIDAVHRCGVLHRDLKPANILLATRPESAAQEGSGGRLPLGAYDPKITDFGLAKDRTTGRDLTLSGTTLGTPCYMSPEQAGARGAALGPPADVYSLGAILYETLTGRPPFGGVTAAETIARLMDDDPLPLSRLRPGLPRDLTTICMKCLEKSPRRRYPTAAALADDLRRFLAGEPILARTTGPLGRAYRWCRRRPLVAGLVALCCGLAIAFVVTVVAYDVKLEEALKQARDKSEEERQQIVQLNVTIGSAAMEEGDTFTAILRFSEALRQDSGLPERERSHRTRIATALRQCPRLHRVFVPGGDFLCARISETGGQVATVDSNRVIELWDVMTGRPAGPALRHRETVSAAALSPDGRSLATLAGGGDARAWNLADGTCQTFHRGGLTDARALLFHSGQRVSLVRGERLLLRQWRLSADAASAGPEIPAGAGSVVSEDGNRIFVVADGCGQFRDAATGEVTGRPLPGAGEVIRSVLSADGRRVACVRSDNTVRIGEPDAGRWLGAALRPSFGVRLAEFSPDGEKLLTAGAGNVALVWRVATGELLATIDSRGGAITFARFSRDGTLLVTGSEYNRARVWEAATGRPLTPPLRHGGALGAAGFTAAGRLITARRAGAICVWELPEGMDSGSSGAAGSVAPRVASGPGMHSPRGAGRLPTGEVVRADGRRFSVGATDDGVRVCDATTEEPMSPVLPHPVTVRLAALSKDGSRLATADEDGTLRVWDVSLGELLALTRSFRRTVRRIALEGTGDKAVITTDDGKIREWDLAPDDRPVEELIRLARVLAGSWIGEDQRRWFFDADGLRAAVRDLDSFR
jgi:WD40 repeat protein